MKRKFLAVVSMFMTVVLLSGTVAQASEFFEWIIEPSLEYEYVEGEHYNEGIWQVSEDGSTYKFVDSGNNVIMDNIIMLDESLELYLGDGLCAVNIDGKGKIIDGNGDVILELDHEIWGYIEEAKLVGIEVETEEHDNYGGPWEYGFVDLEGNIVIPAEYDSIFEMDDLGWLGCKKDGKWGIIDTKGNIICDVKYEEVNWSEYFVACIDDGNNNNIIIDRETGNILNIKGSVNVFNTIRGIPLCNTDEFLVDGILTNSKGESFPEKTAIVKNKFDEIVAQYSNETIYHKWSIFHQYLPDYLNKNCYELQLDGPSIGSVYSYVNEKGEIIFSQYENLWKYSDNLICVTDKETKKQGIINNDGDVIVPVIYEYITWKSDNLICAYTDDYESRVLFDSNGDRIGEFKDIQSQGDFFAIWDLNGKLGFAKHPWAESPKKDFVGLSLANKTYTYDGAEKGMAVSGTVPSGATVTYTYDGSTEKPTEAGIYAVKATVSKDGYNDLVLNATMKIDQKNLTVTAKSYTIKQNNPVPTLEYDITAGELVSGDSITGTLSVNADGTRLGEFDITQGTVTAGNNYALTFVKGKLTVVDKTPQEIVVATIGEKTYGDADFAVSVTPDETANLSAFAYASSNTDVAEIAADGTITIKAAGETDITVTEPGNADYAVFTNTQKLVVNKKGVTVTSVDLDAKTAVLDGVLSGDTAVALNFDKLNLEIIDAVNETTSNVKVTGFELEGEKSDNYTVTTTELNSTITTDNVATITATADGGTVTGAGSYIKGSTVTVVATPTRGFVFNGWMVGNETVSTNTTYTFVANENKDLVAKFVKQATGGGDSTYTVKFETNGGSKISNKSVRKNTSVTEPAIPSKNGYTFVGWYSDAELTTPHDFADIVKKDTTLYAKWEETVTVEPEPTEKPEDVAKTPFSDVKADAWYADAVKFAVENKLMNGVSDTEFAPNATLTRAMLVTILYRNDGEPAVDTEVAFDDVATGSYYEKAVAWAKANGIVDGYTDNVFAPDANITREQIATIMHRYATYKGYDVNKSAEISERDDYSEISDYAVSAMQYMVGSGLINGKTDKTLEPQDKATRAEIATILQRFITSNN
ncbi:MAG: S-layer homology domain-containing protein [Clostridia bacterium]|nr:S-layer homology domain-containing protein [Clostridia bacterium]